MLSNSSNKLEVTTNYNFVNMSKEDVQKFFEDLESCRGLGDMLNKGYSFGGTDFRSNEVFVYKNSTSLVKL